VWLSAKGLAIDPGTQANGQCLSQQNAKGVWVDASLFGRLSGSALFGGAAPTKTIA
jgi:hypothetical protein